MVTHRVTLVLEGMERDQGHVRLDVFVEQLTKLQATLARTDKSLSGGRRSGYFAIVGLSHSSPATVELEARVNPKNKDVRTQIFSHVSELIEAVERDAIPATVDYPLLEDLRALAAPIGATLRTASLKLNGSTFVLTEHFAKRIDEHLAEQEQCFSTLEGMLEKLNVHRQANVFTIYSTVGPAHVTCHFPPPLVDKAISAVKRRVAVSGIAKYRKFDAYPHHVDVTQLEIYAPEDQLPTFNDLRGIAPDATGKQASEQFIREFRNGWQ